MQKSFSYIFLNIRWSVLTHTLIELWYDICITPNVFIITVNFPSFLFGAFNVSDPVKNHFSSFMCCVCSSSHHTGSLLCMKSTAVLVSDTKSVSQKKRTVIAEEDFSVTSNAHKCISVFTESVKISWWPLKSRKSSCKLLQLLIIQINFNTSLHVYWCISDTVCSYVGEAGLSEIRFIRAVGQWSD